MNFSFKQCAVTLCAASVFAATGSAAIIPVSINLNATGAVGSGTAVIDQTAQTLTAFNFTQTITIGPNSGIYTYGLADITGVAIAAGNGFNQLVFQLSSIPVAGTPNTLGPYALVLAYSAANPGVGTDLGATTIQGPITVAVSAVPEPSTLSLMGFAGVGLLAFRRLKRS